MMEEVPPPCPILCREIANTIYTNINGCIVPTTLNPNIISSISNNHNYIIQLPMRNGVIAYFRYIYNEYLNILELENRVQIENENDINIIQINHGTS